jgi:hypothetical protein
MINLFVANTDNAWFDFLSAERDLTEVNFWWPGETNFRALSTGRDSSLPTEKPTEQNWRLWDLLQSHSSSDTNGLGVVWSKQWRIVS